MLVLKKEEQDKEGEDGYGSEEGTARVIQSRTNREVLWDDAFV
jgi:hypothetical protein